MNKKANNLGEKIKKLYRSIGHEKCDNDTFVNYHGTRMKKCENCGLTTCSYCHDVSEKICVMCMIKDEPKECHSCNQKIEFSVCGCGELLKKCVSNCCFNMSSLVKLPSDYQVCAKCHPYGFQMR